MPSEKLETNSKIVIEKFKMDPEIRENNSQQDLVRIAEDVSDQQEKTLRDLKLREWIAVFILCFVNLINYMDRFTIAGKFIHCLVIFLALEHIDKFYQYYHKKNSLEKLEPII